MTRQPIHAPLFIVGTGRCGTTILHRMLARHSQLAFLVRHVDQNPSQPALNSLVLDWLDGPAGSNSQLRDSIAPVEAWRFWDHYAPGFSRSFSDLKADDVTVRVKETLHRVVPKLLTERRTRLLVKLTGWTRIGFIKEVFPDAKVVHIIRDPRAVAASLLSVRWWRGWQGPEQWRWGPLTNKEASIWLESDRSFPVLAAIQWTKIMAAYKRSLHTLPESLGSDILAIRYHELCASPDDLVHKVLSFSGLKVSEAYLISLSEHRLESRNHKWQQELTLKQQKDLEHALESLDWTSYIHE